MLSDSEKKLLVWALDCALTERQKVSMLKYGSVLKAAKDALQDPAVRDRVLGIIEIFSPEKAEEIRDFLNTKK